MNDIQIKGSEDYGKLCCFRDDEGNESYGHLSLFMKANSNNPNERDMYFCMEDGKAYRMAWKLDEEDVLTPDEEVIHEQNEKIERLQEQLNEANEVIRFYSETTVGHKQKDGTYGMWVCSGEVAWENPLDRIKTRMDYICYDPRPAKKWLKKWGLK